MSDDEDEEAHDNRGGRGARKAGPPRPPPRLGGWRSRDGYAAMKALIAQEGSRFRILPHADSPVGWVAYYLCAPERRKCVPIYCSICDQDASTVTIQNFVNTKASAGCVCTFRPKFCTLEGRAVVAALAAEKKATLVVPAEEWVAEHRLRSVRWSLIELKCNECGATRHMNATGVMHKKRIGSICACQRAAPSKKRKVLEETGS